MDWTGPKKNKSFSKLHNKLKCLTTDPTCHVTDSVIPISPFSNKANPIPEYRSLTKQHTDISDGFSDCLLLFLDSNYILLVQRGLIFFFLWYIQTLDYQFFFSRKTFACVFFLFFRFFFFADIFMHKCYCRYLTTFISTYGR